MKIQRLFLLCVTAGAVCLPTSCGKDDDGPKSDYMKGAIILTMDKYVRPGDKYTFDLDRMSTLSGPEKLRYYWTAPITNKKDTLAAGVKRFSYTIPDSLSTFTISCTGYDEDGGYYSSTGSVYFVVVDPKINEGTLTNYKVTDEQFTDNRDGKTYFETSVAGTFWMAQNLAYEAAGDSYWGSKAMTDIFGCFYTAEQARTVCPEGWSLPDENDWIAMTTALGAPKVGEMELIEGVSGKIMGDTYFNKEKMWEFWPAVKITNDISFNAMPIGYATVDNGVFHYTGYGQYSGFWSMTSTGELACRYFFLKEPDIHAMIPDQQGFALPVRCVRK